jgi:alpha-N-arabinofuranosidase
MAIISGAICYSGNGLFTFEESDSCKIHIHAQDKARKPITRYMYGKFTEHLGRNIYGGMWAQILNNPSFEGWHFWGENSEDIDRRLRHYAERLGITNITDSRDKGIAPWWLAHGSGEVTYELDTNAFNSELAQKIVVDSLEGYEAGIKQILFLPLHREKDYELIFYSHSEKSCTLNIAIRKAEDENHKLAMSQIKVTSDEWQQHFLKFSINDDVDKGTPLLLTAGLSKPGTVWLDQIFLFPEDHVSGFDPDIVKFIRDSRLPLLRYPGGNFASGYHWKDGIGPINKRRTTYNRPWSMIEYNHMGTDEFMNFCAAVGAEPLICVNAGDGSPQEAAEWVEYCNGSPDTKYGALRAENGHPSPYNVTYWEIGNELYGNWQIGHCTPEEYAERYERFYQAMKIVDPNIKIIANGQDKKWNAPIIREKSHILRSLSTHTLIGSGTPEDADPEEVFESLMAYTYFYEDHLRGMGKQMVEKVENPLIAVTELQIFTNRPNLPNNSTLSEALFWSGIVNSCIRLDGLVEMITHSALVNHGGGLRKEREIVYANPVYYARKLYSTQSGNVPVRIQIQCPMYKSSGRYSPKMDVPYLDAVALMNEEDNELNIIITNRHPHESLAVHFSLNNFEPEMNVEVRMLKAESYMATNEWRDTERVKLDESVIKVVSGELDYPVPAHSIVLLKFRRKGG